MSFFASASTKSLTMTPASGTQITTSEGATDNVEVSCLAELANPAAEITWSLNGKSVELDPRFTIADPIIQGIISKFLKLGLLSTFVS